jgi:hypothetical protein
LSAPPLAFRKGVPVDRDLLEQILWTRRRDEVRSGTVKPISADEVSRQVRDALKR